MGWDWIKVATDLDNHPKARNAGWDGINVFDRLLRLNGRLRGPGVIPSSYSDPEYLASQWNTTADTVTRGINACVTAQLVTMREDGSLEIRGWDEEWKPILTGAERQKRYRDRHRQKDLQAQKVVTQRDASDARDKRNVKGREGKRREEKRREVVQPAGCTPRAGARGPADPSSRVTPPGMTPAEALSTLAAASHGAVVASPCSKGAAVRLGEQLAHLSEQGVGPAELALAGEWMGVLGFHKLPPPYAPGLLATDGILADAIAKATAWSKAGKPTTRAGPRDPGYGRHVDKGKEHKDYTDT